MASKKRGGGLGSAVMLILALAFVVTFFRVPEHQSVEGVHGFFASRSETVKTWVEGMAEGNFGLNDLFNGNASGGKPSSKPSGTLTDAAMKTSEAEKAVAGIKESKAQNVAYDRKEWKHWSSVSGNSSCWNTRAEVLYRQAEKGSAVLLDKNKKKVTSKSDACTVGGGTWVDPYSGKKFTDPSKLDIDHMVPLKYTASHGGQDWSAKQKEKYANSLEAGHLLAVAAGENRSKGDRGPSAWKPSDKSNWCAYAKNWTSVTVKWKLTNTATDKKALVSMLKTC